MVGPVDFDLNPLGLSGHRWPCATDGSEGCGRSSTKSNTVVDVNDAVELRPSSGHPEGSVDARPARWIRQDTKTNAVDGGCGWVSTDVEAGDADAEQTVTMADRLGPQPTLFPAGSQSS